MYKRQARGLPGHPFRRGRLTLRQTEKTHFFQIDDKDEASRQNGDVYKRQLFLFSLRRSELMASGNGKTAYAETDVVIDTVHSQKTVKTCRTIAHAPERPVPDQLAEHAELPIRQVPQLRVAFDGPLSPQHAELPLQAVRTPRYSCLLYTSALPPPRRALQRTIALSSRF